MKCPICNDMNLVSTVHKRGVLVEANNRGKKVMHYSCSRGHRWTDTIIDHKKYNKYKEINGEEIKL